MDGKAIDEARDASYLRAQEFSTSARERWPYLRCGIDCGAGWVPLLEEMLDGIAPLAEGTDYHITQVKEKFGGLRVYDNAEGHEGIRDLIERAKDRAWETCEISGDPGELGSDRGYLCVRSESLRRTGTIQAKPFDQPTGIRHRAPGAGS